MNRKPAPLAATPTLQAAYRTTGAARYCTERGVQVSPRTLEAMRTSRTDLSLGPDFLRDERGVCWYPREALDRWVIHRMDKRQLRARAPMPTQLRNALGGARDKAA